MRRWLLLMLFMFLWIPKGQAEVNVQQLIDQANPGDTVILLAGEYEGSYTITKPLTLKGAVTFTNNGKEPVLTIDDTNNVHVEGVLFQTIGTAIEVKKSNHITFSNLQLQNVNAGINLYNSSVIAINNVKMLGRAGHYSQKGNGIGVYRSDNIQVTNTEIDNVQDGVYMEEVRDVTLKQNQVTNSRYGMHFMYSEDAVVQSNRLDNNVTGFMVMIANGVLFEKNQLVKQRGLNSYGVVFYDVQNVRFEHNVLSLNRTAISIQKSQQIKVLNNQFQMNQTAIEATRSDGSNRVSNNSFTGNILTARSDANGVLLEGNYYDNYTGIDANDDGIGDTPFVALSSFGQWMVREPAYQYFIEAPAVTVLTTVDEQINRASTDLLSDKAPLMKTKAMQKIVETNNTINSWQLVVGLFLVIVSTFWWRRGIRV